MAPTKIVSISVPPDLYAAIEEYRAMNCPEASVAATTVELIRAALQGDQHVDSVVRNATQSARQAEARAFRRWVHERLRVFLADVLEESNRIT